MARTSSPKPGPGWPSSSKRTRRPKRRADRWRTITGKRIRSAVPGLQQAGQEPGRAGPDDPVERAALAADLGAPVGQVQGGSRTGHGRDKRAWPLAIAARYDNL